MTPYCHYRTHGSFIIWFSIVRYYRQDLILHYTLGPDLILEYAIQPTFSALEQKEMTFGIPYYKRAISVTKPIIQERGNFHQSLLKYVYGLFSNTVQLF